MGFINVLLNFTRVFRRDAKISDVEVDPGGGALVTPEHFEDAGSDSHPMPDDYVATMEVPRRGGVVAVGYLDPKAPQIAGPGEKAIYSRDASGNLIARVHLKSDGTVVLSGPIATVTYSPNGTMILSNPNGSFVLNNAGEHFGFNGSGSYKLETGGDFVVNGVIISAAGSMTIPGGQSITTPGLSANGVQVVDHIHDAGTPPGDTGIMK